MSYEKLYEILEKDGKMLSLIIDDECIEAKFLKFNNGKIINTLNNKPIDKPINEIILARPDMSKARLTKGGYYLTEDEYFTLDEYLEKFKKNT